MSYIIVTPSEYKVKDQNGNSQNYETNNCAEAEEFAQELRDQFIKENESIIGWGKAYDISTRFYVVDTRECQF